MEQQRVTATAPGFGDSESLLAARALLLGVVPPHLAQAYADDATPAPFRSGESTAGDDQLAGRRARPRGIDVVDDRSVLDGHAPRRPGAEQFRTAAEGHPVVGRARSAAGTGRARSAAGTGRVRRAVGRAVGRV